MNCSLKASRALQAAGLGGILAQAHLLQPHLFDLRFEFAILRAHAAQIEVIVPDVAGAAS